VGVYVLSVYTTLSPVSVYIQPVYPCIRRQANHKSGVLLLASYASCILKGMYWILLMSSHIKKVVLGIFGIF
jgi:hypothetical protein